MDDDDTMMHPETGEPLRRETRPMTLTYATYTRTLDVPGWYPTGDGDAIHSGRDLAGVDAALGEMRESYAADLRRLRRSLKLTQEAAGKLFGGGKRAFQKYEAGKMSPSDAAVGLIELVRVNPAAIDVLKALPGRALETA